MPQHLHHIEQRGNPPPFPAPVLTHIFFPVAAKQQNAAFKLAHIARPKHGDTVEVPPRAGHIAIKDLFEMIEASSQIRRE